MVIVLEKKFREQIMQDHEDADKAIPIQQELDRLVQIEIERKKDFDNRFFTKRVPRCIPAPSVLIPRVRAVVGAFADLTDTKTKKPLFDDKARKKVDAFIAEIKLGHYSDMPGIVYYKYKLDKKGRVMRDEDGLALLKCNRGTNDVFFREAILMMELPRRHAASLERAAGSHPIRVQSMGGGRGRDRAQMTYSSSGLLSGSVWQMRRLWLAAHQTPPACASIP